MKKLKFFIWFLLFILCTNILTAQIMKNVSNNLSIFTYINNRIEKYCDIEKDVLIIVFPDETISINKKIYIMIKIKNINFYQVDKLYIMLSDCITRLSDPKYSENINWPDIPNFNPDNGVIIYNDTKDNQWIRK